MDSEAFGMVQILKYAYKTNFLSAKYEAGQHEAMELIEFYFQYIFPIL